MKIKNVFLAGWVVVATMSAIAAAQAEDVRMFVRHEITDYGTWRKAYDGFAPTQKKLGVVSQSVYRGIENTNDITVIHDFKSLEKAKAFSASPELKAAMEKAGVKGAPQIWFTASSKK